MKNTIEQNRKEMEAMRLEIKKREKIKKKLQFKIWEDCEETQSFIEDIQRQIDNNKNVCLFAHDNEVIKYIDIDSNFTELMGDGDFQEFLENNHVHIFESCGSWVTSYDYECYFINPDGDVYLNGSIVFNNDDYHDENHLKYLIEADIEKNGVFTGAYYGNDHDNEVTPLDLSVPKDEASTRVEYFKTQHNQNHIKLLVDGIHGVHIPKRFVSDFDLEAWDISEAYQDEINDIKNDTENSAESWDYICEYAEHIDNNGITWKLEMIDGELFAVSEYYIHD